MKETGIIMSGSHPGDIIEMRKTMTRRTWGLEEINEIPDLWCDPFYDPDIGRWGFWQKYTGDVIYLKCPYGGVGDRLWVRETWATDDYHDVLKPSELPQTATIYYIASTGRDLIGIGKIRSSLFMPRWTSRITREITEVRAERLQEITEKDALAEGYKSEYTLPGGKTTSAYSFALGWDSLNAKRGYGWEFNPWVWPIGFKLLEAQ